MKNLIMCGLIGAVFSVIAFLSFNGVTQSDQARQACKDRNGFYLDTGRNKLCLDKSVIIYGE